MTNKRKFLTAILAVVFATVAAMPVMAQNEKAADEAVAKLLKELGLKDESEIVVVNNWGFKIEVTILAGESTLVNKKAIAKDGKATIKVPNHTSYAIQAKGWDDGYRGKDYKKEKPVWIIIPSFDLNLPEFSRATITVTCTYRRIGMQGNPKGEVALNKTEDLEIQSAIAKVRAAAMTGDTKAVDDAIAVATGKAPEIVAAKKANKAADDAEAKVLKAANLKPETQFVITNNFGGDYKFRVTIKSGDSTLVSKKTIKSGATVTIKVPVHTNYMIEAEYYYLWWGSMPSLNLAIPDYSVVSLRAYYDEKSKIGETSRKIEQTKVESLVSPEIQAAIAKARAAAMEGDTEAVNEAIAAAKGEAPKLAAAQKEKDAADKALAAIAAVEKAAKAKEDAKENINFETAISTSWFPLASLQGGENLKYDMGLFNFGLSATMGLKFFKDYGTYLDLKIGDPTFETAVDLLGLLNIKWVFLKFDYHSYGGKVSWTGGDPNPIPGGKDFLTNVTTFSIMADLVKLWDIDEDMGMDLDGFHGMIAIGAFYGTGDFPQLYGKEDTIKPGFGPVYTQVYGASFVLTAQDYFLYGKHTGLHIFFNGLIGGGTTEYDKDLIKKVEDENGLESGTLDKKGGAFLLRLDGVIAITKTWKIANTYIGYDIGADLMLEVFQGVMVNFGPILRFHLNW